MRRWACLTLFATIATFSAPRAEATVSRGLFRLGLDTPLVTWAKGAVVPDQGQKREFEGLTLGLGMSQAGLLVGTTFGGSWLLGTRFHIGQEARDWYLEGTETFNWSVRPHLEYIFAHGTFRPYLTVGLGVEGAKRDPFNFFGFVVDGGGGAHIFVLNRTSIDLAMLVGGRFGGGEQGDSSGEFNHWRFHVTTLFGLSAWF